MKFTRPTPHFWLSFLIVMAVTDPESSFGLHVASGSRLKPLNYPALIFSGGWLSVP